MGFGITIESGQITSHTLELARKQEVEADIKTLQESSRKFKRK